ncbi:MAG: DUF3883 domain-containing protein [Bacteroidota bacterium]|nr:DUF3883 domain-containing protein [Bacteroidota bacterium]
MPSLQDQLNGVQQEQAKLKIKYSHHFKLEKYFSYAEVIAWFIPFFSIIAFCVWIAALLPGNYSGGLFVLFFYGGLFLCGLLQIGLSNLFNYFIRRKLKINKSQSLDFENIRKTLIERKLRIEREIKEELKRSQYQQESRFISKLEEAVTTVIYRRLSYEAAIELNKQLELEHNEIKKNGYQIHTNIFYTNRFIKIQRALKNYTNAPGVIIQNEIKKAANKSSVSTTNTIPVENKPAPKSSTDLSETKSIPATELKSSESINDKTKPVDNTEIKVNPKDINIVRVPSPINRPANPNVINPTNKEKPAPKEEEKTVTELFGDLKEAKQDDITKAYQPKAPEKIDFARLNEYRHNIGELGELYILQKEQNHLISKGKINESKEIFHVASKSDSEGYDIISFTDSGERKYIEVKTTTGNQYEPFYLSNSEMEAMKRLNNYWIYRVYNFNIDLKKGDFYKIDCSRELETYYHIKASSFKVSPKL